MRKVEKSQVEKSPHNENSLEEIDLSANKRPTVKVSWHAKKVLDGIQNEASQAGKKKPKQWDIVDSWLAAYQSALSGSFPKPTFIDLRTDTEDGDILLGQAKSSHGTGDLTPTVSQPNHPVYIVREGKASRIIGPFDFDELQVKLGATLEATLTQYLDDVKQKGGLLKEDKNSHLLRLRKEHKEKTPEPK